MSTSTKLVENVKLPRFVRVRQEFPHSELTDEEVLKIFNEQVKAMEGRVKPGQRICITAGSRGIDHMPMVLKAIQGITEYFTCLMISTSASSQAWLAAATSGEHGFR